MTHTSLGLRFLACVVLPVLGATAARSQCPEAVPGFGAAGADASVYEARVIDLGTGPALYVAGAFRSIGSERATFLARLEGAAFVPFAEGLQPPSSSTGGGVNGLLPYDDGSGLKLYVTGSFDGPSGSNIRNVARWNGSTWEAVGAPLSALAGAFAELTVLDDGTGPALHAISGNGFGSNFTNVWKLASGVWTMLPGGPLGDEWDALSLSALSVYDDGAGPALYVGGKFSSLQGVGACTNLARWRAGTWSAISFTLSESFVTDLVVHDDGSGSQLFVGIWNGGLGLARWNGSFTYFPSATMNVTRLVPMGAAMGMPAGLWTLGAYSTAANARVWTGSALLPVPGTQFPTLYQSISCAAAWPSATGADAFLGGSFNNLNGVRAQNLARGSTAGWEPVAIGNGLSGVQDVVSGSPQVRAILANPNAGSSGVVVAGQYLGTAGTLAVEGFASWNGAAWQSLDYPLGGYPVANVKALTTFDFGAGEELVACGDFFGFARIVRKSSGGWMPAGSSPPGTASSLAILDNGAGRKLYAGGFGCCGGLYRLDGGAWTTVLSDHDHVVSMCAHDDGTGPALYVAGGFGSFAPVPGLPAPFNGIARFDGTNWSPVGSIASSFLLYTQVASLGDGSAARLYVHGNFPSIEGIAAGGLARWDGSMWSQFGGGFVGAVESVALFDDGSGHGQQLIAGGLFTSAGGTPARNLARFDGLGWSEFAGGTSGGAPFFGGMVNCMTVVHDPALGGTVLALGGPFTEVGSTPAKGFALIASCDQTGELYCFGDGSSGACPCANESIAGDRVGCLNSFGTGGSLRARGFSSLSSDTLELDGAAMTNSSVLYFQGAHPTSGIPFGDGIKCTSGPFVRLGTKVNSGGASSYPQAGDVPIAQRGLITAPGTRHYQLRYRNAAAFCTPDAFNYSNAVAIVWRL